MSKKNMDKEILAATLVNYVRSLDIDLNEFAEDELIDIAKDIYERGASNARMRMLEGWMTVTKENAR